MRDIRKTQHSLTISDIRSSSRSIARDLSSSSSLLGDDVSETVFDNVLEKNNDDDGNDHIIAYITSSHVGLTGIIDVGKVTELQVTVREKSEDLSCPSMQEQHTSLLCTPSLTESENQSGTTEEQYGFYDKWTAHWSDNHERTYYYKLSTNQAC